MGILSFLKPKKEDVPVYDLSAGSDGLTQELMANYNKHRPLGPQTLICGAPSKNMYFGHSGYVTTCCYNRQHLLGTYPQKSISEIWFGEEAEKLRNFIKQNNLAHGCEGCLSQILSENFDATKAKQYDYARFNENKYPSVMEFELENTCNLECVMCSGNFSSLIRANREKRPPLVSNYDADFISQLEEFIPYLEEVKFYGGEPFLIEIYYQIIELIIKLNPSVRISIQTNATILNNRVKTILSKANVHLNLSIDSLEKENYESIRVNAKFERVMENLEYFYQYCKEKKTFFGISVCALSRNWHELPEFVRFCNRLNVPVYFHTVFFPASEAIHSMEQDKLKVVVSKLESELETLPEENMLQRKNKTHLADLIKHTGIWQQKGHVEPSFVIEWNEQIQRLRTIDDLIDLISGSTLNPQEGTSMYSTEQVNEVLEKLKALKMRMPEDFDYKPIFENIKVYSKHDPIIREIISHDYIGLLIKDINRQTIEEMVDDLNKSVS